MLQLNNPLLAALLKRVPVVDIPNNPRNKKKEKQKHSYFFVSTRVKEYTDEKGIIHQYVIGVSYKKEK